MKSAYKAISSIITAIPTCKGSCELKELYPEGLPFEVPKPSDLLLHLLEQTRKDEDFIVGFFQLQLLCFLRFLNGIVRRVQIVILSVFRIPKVLKDFDAFQMGFSCQSDLAFDRIKRVVKRYPDMDTGFKFLCIDRVD
jgi:adenine-specific DNA-methyltransferase